MQHDIQTAQSHTHHLSALLSVSPLQKAHSQDPCISGVEPLQGFLATKLTGVFAFVGDVSTGLDTDVVAGDRESLMLVMGHIRNVRKRMKEMDLNYSMTIEA